MKREIKFPKAAVWPTVILLILIGAWMWWGLARLLSEGRIDAAITRMRYGGRPLHRVVFPPIRDRDGVIMGLAPGGCGASDAPPYSVALRGDGAVEFTGSDEAARVGLVAVPGHHTARIPPDEARTMVQRFQAADFFWLRDRYQAPAQAGLGAMTPVAMTDSSWCLSLTVDGQRKQVSDLGGAEIGMPAVVGELEKALAEATGVARWTKGDASTIPLLKREGWDFTADTPANGGLLVGATGARNIPLVRDLLAAGAPVKGVYGCRALTAAAFGSKYKAVFDLVRAAGAPLKAGDCAVPLTWPGPPVQPR